MRSRINIFGRFIKYFLRFALFPLVTLFLCNTIYAQNPDFIRQASETYGSSCIVVCIDVKKSFFGKEKTYILNGSQSTKFSSLEFAQIMEEKGAGEIIIQSIERDGTMLGYDINLIRRISESVSIPIVALGGAGEIIHLKKAYQEGFASGLAAGSMFVYHGSRNAILINYPNKKDLNTIF